MENEFFTPKTHDLSRLKPHESHGFFRDLLHAEAQRLGVPIGKITISSNETIPDGGIDAIVEDCSLKNGEIIACGVNTYQIKTGTSFSPTRLADVQKEIINKKTGCLEDGIAECFEKDGRYVLVLFGKDLNSMERKKSVLNIEKSAKKFGYKNPKVEVWSQNHILGLIKNYPSLALLLAGKLGLSLQPHEEWGQDAEIKNKGLQLGDEQNKFIENLRNIVVGNLEKNPKHTRILGEAGVGKTRLVYESLAHERLKPFVIYAENAQKLLESDALSTILRAEAKHKGIIVADECPEDLSKDIWKKLEARDTQLQLISIDNEKMNEPHPSIDILDAPRLPNEQIAKIIQSYGTQSRSSKRWSELCEGSPRFAHILGENLRSNPEPEKLLLDSATTTVIKRFIEGSSKISPQAIENRLIVARYAALFKKFGFEEPVDCEARAISEIIQKRHPQITWTVFRQVIKELRGRKIIQGNFTYYLTPKVLHIKLWLDWWNSYSDDSVIDEIPDRLRGWFDEMFRYAGGSKESIKVLDRFLGDEGLFVKEQNNFRIERYARLFGYLTEASPELALKCLRKTIYKWNEEELKNFTTGRQMIVWALEKIVLWKNLFKEGAQVLLRLAATENAKNTNNATGIFKYLFAIVPGPVGFTGAPPKERLTILKDALKSKDKDARLVGIEACKNALYTGSRTRVVGAEHQGLMMEPECWHPKTYGEWWNAYKEVWKLLSEKIKSLKDNEKKLAGEALISNARGLLEIPKFDQIIIATLKSLASLSEDIKKIIIKEVHAIEKYSFKKLKPDTKKRILALKKNLNGTSFHSKMIRYVGTEIFDETRERSGKEPTIKKFLKQLAKHAIQKKHILKKELRWLVTPEAKNGYLFGVELAFLDRKQLLWNDILKSFKEGQPNSSTQLIAGYLKGIYDFDQSRWTALIREIVSDKSISPHTADIVRCSGLNEEITELLGDLLGRNEITSHDLRFFAWGGVVEKITSRSFLRWIKLLMQVNTREACSAALELMAFRFIVNKSKRRLPTKITMQLLTNPSFFKESGSPHERQSDSRHWSEVCRAFLNQNPTHKLEMAKFLIDNLDEGEGIMSEYRGDAKEVLVSLVEEYPKETWNVISKKLDKNDCDISLQLEHSLSRRDIVSLFPQDEIWKWVRKNPKTRAPIIADMAPKDLSLKKGSLLREVLSRYGQYKEVRRSAYPSFDSWTGPSSLHYSAQKTTLLSAKKTERSSKVIAWINQFVEGLDRQIEQSRVDEERGW